MRLGTIWQRKSRKRLLAKVQPSCNEDPRTLEIPTPWSGAGLSLSDTLCVLCMAEPESSSCSRPLSTKKTVGPESDTEFLHFWT